MRTESRAPRRRRFMHPERSTVQLVNVTIMLLGFLCTIARPVLASTYTVYIPLDSSIYEELDTLNNVGYLDSYLDEIKPISRIEAARLVLEARANLSESGSKDPLASTIVDCLIAQLTQEVKWLASNSEDDLPAIFQPLQRAEAQYLFSRGEQRLWRTSVIGSPGEHGINAEEATPLFADNDGLPTAPGSNEIFRWSGWAGLGGFLTAYGEGAVAGPLTRTSALNHGGRIRPLGTAAVLSLGNLALSIGMEEMRWGTGYFAPLSQGNNASPFPALRLQNIHPTLLPGFFRYLGQFRYQLFFGQLDDDRYFAHPWIDGQVFAFKPLPDFEFGLTHEITFGGVHNNGYGIAGFIGRASGFATGNPQGANTKSRGGIYLKFRFPRLRGVVAYQEMLGTDNLTREIPLIGRTLPFLSVSYQGGLYLPRLTRDGLTDLRFEYAILEPSYSTHAADSLYFTYNGNLMGDPLGPNASQIDLQLGRWLTVRDKLQADIFYTEQAPNWASVGSYPHQIYPYPLTKEHSTGLGIDLLQLPRVGYARGLLTLRARGNIEETWGLNYRSRADSLRLLLMLSVSFAPRSGGWPHS